MTIIRIAAILLAMVGIATQERAAVAQAYPSKPVKLVVPYAPGGPTDIIARILAQKLAEGLGGSFFVENTAGAGGTIATGQAANAAADGTTILVANQDLIVQPIIKTKVPYDPFRSFLPVSLVVSAPEMIVVHPSLPAKDLKELIALLKTNPGKYSYASPGYGTTPHLACVWLFNLENGIDITHVPFQGAAPAVQSVLAGQTPVFHNVLPTVAPYIRAGTMRALSVAASKRTPLPRCADHRRSGVSGPRGRILDGSVCAGGHGKRCGRNPEQAGGADHGAARCQGAGGNDRFRPDFELLTRTGRPYESGNRQMVAGGPPG